MNYKHLKYIRIMSIYKEFHIKKKDIEHKLDKARKGFVQHWIMVHNKTY